MIRVSRVTQAQMGKLLDLLSKDGILVDGKVAYSDTNKQCFWKGVAKELNSVEGGVYKNHWKWCKVWSDWKFKTLKKANIQLRKKYYSFIPSKTTLSNLEIRLLKVINYPMHEDATNILKFDKKNGMIDGNHSTIETPMDFLEDSYTEEVQLNKHENISDDEDNTNLSEFARNKSEHCNIDDLLGGNHSEVESLDIEKKVNIMTGNKSEGESSDTNLRGKKLRKRKKMTLEEFKIRVSIKLEREKTHQRNEELRLKAIELKLKGEELKVKELEINKINYLTNIEEEKMRCLKDISTSLKELLELSKNTNGRFQNLL